MILLIDNFDSFSYNLYQMIGTISPDITVRRNNAVTAGEIERLHPDGIVLSPGPGRPENSGICPELVRKMKGKIPILGVCLGEQAIAIACGGTVGYAGRLVHGKQSEISLDHTSPLFQGLPDRILAARYHSLAVKEESLKKTGLRVTSRTDDGEVMAIEDTEHRLFGLQFHPESVMTPEGMHILENYVKLCGE